MCRLLGYAAPAPTVARALIGSDQLARFASLSHLHGDGWGTSWTAGGTPVERFRSTRPAAHDDEFVAHTEQRPASSRIVHLRWATEGYAVDTRNTHPFHIDGISFAHNGAIQPASTFDELLSPANQAQLRGDTDSERYFALVRQERLTGTGDLAAAVGRAASSLRTRHPRASLNALLLTTDELLVVHANSHLAAPLEEMLALPDGAPHDHVAAYFLMRWRRTEDGSVIFVSSGLDAADWEPLPEESVTAVDLHTMSVQTRSLGELSAEGLVA